MEVLVLTLLGLLGVIALVTGLLFLSVQGGGLLSKGYMATEEFVALRDRLFAACNRRIAVKRERELQSV